jgi:hypothetical protein
MPEQVERAEEGIQDEVSLPNRERKIYPEEDTNTGYPIASFRNSGKKS